MTRKENRSRVKSKMNGIISIHTCKRSMELDDFVVGLGGF